MRLTLLCLGLLVASPGLAQETELSSCLADGGFCTETATDVVVDSSCGQVFYAYRGRVSWPSLRNEGPITIAVRTHKTESPLVGFPLYVEIIAFPDSLECTDPSPGTVVLVAQGSYQCGGVWESIGPIDLTEGNIALGATYVVQVEFFASLPDHHQLRNVGLSCIRVTSHPSAIERVHWAQVKALYR